ncbi:MAG: DNA-3-methyladenine glycosylase I [Rhodospirillales bacterium]|jgi:DNA-3-methyladenine glycosylase I|nr:DNA-3-methyladenine glycosylase [Rhodospirillaceae bacterium]MDP6427591.1 DNA-3-methyladenine glycosylase I [Rhodospirillales bacterium]MDP6643493.1 DNA-3-methyladenine glycosylase I [Rhodospirillales bacterium]MDP6842585.1 DNA-3-methyladenine glycosylase I [Rhodospirillales bacterium]|tara:strand:- start:528 stop:1088 length:561 start_codon:yes stop_codon:yes gene_type:complete
MSSYCVSAPSHPFHGPYHDTEYGFPIEDEAALFERLTLEVFQAGLSWLIILKKREGLKIAFENFNADRVAGFDGNDVERLIKDASIIRNRRKIEATIENAHRIIDLRDSHGGFANWIDQNHPRPKDEWVKLFRKNFKFMGGEIVGEFLMSIGYLPGAHQQNCPVYEKIAACNPAWLTMSGEIKKAV